MTAPKNVDALKDSVLAPIFKLLEIHKPARIVNFSKGVRFHASARLREPDVIQLNFFLPDATKNYYVVLKADGTPVDVVAQVEEGEAIPAPAAVVLSPLTDQKWIVAYDVQAQKIDQFRVP